MARGVGGQGPANIMKHLGGMGFPANKRQLIDHARQAAGPDTDQVVKVLQRIDDREYATPADVMSEVGDIE
jgi:hypothetical protein